MLLAYCDLMDEDGASENHQAGRIKQWMALIRKSHAQGATCFDEIKRIRSIDELRAKLRHDMTLRENQRQDVPIAAE